MMKQGTEIKIEQKFVFRVERQTASLPLIHLCPIIEEGRVKKLIIQIFITHRKLPSEQHLLLIENKNGWEGLDFGQFAFKDKLNFPTVWSTYFCPIHKTHSLKMYVPENSVSFLIKTELNKLSFHWQ